MGALDRFEKNIERAVSGVFTKAFRSEVKPVELASALRREIDDRAAVVAQDRTVVPNSFAIELGPSDDQQVQSWGAEALADELVANLTEYAQQQRYAFVGPVSVRFQQAQDLETGRFRVYSSTERGAVAPATARTPNRPIVDIDGQRYILTGAITVVGRGSEADIIVDDSGVSRQHIEIRILDDGTPILTDLGSTNGTFVESHKVDAATLVDGNTITIGRTRIMFWTGEDAANQDG